MGTARNVSNRHDQGVPILHRQTDSANHGCGSTSLGCAVRNRFTRGGLIIGDVLPRVPASRGSGTSSSYMSKAQTTGLALRSASLWKTSKCPVPDGGDGC